MLAGRGEWRVASRSVWQDDAAESGGVRAAEQRREEAIVRNTVRKFVGVALIGVLGAFALQASAGAQTDDPTYHHPAQSPA